MNEATARLKINRLLEKAGWRFFPEGNTPANVRLEPHVAIKTSDLDGLGTANLLGIETKAVGVEGVGVPRFDSTEAGPCSVLY